MDQLSGLSDDQSVSTWNRLPEPPKPETPAAEGGARRGPPMFSGPVLYAATWCGDHVLLRRGDSLFSVEVLTGGETTAAKETTDETR